jgi:Tfp pilus assembly protein PilV
MTPQLFAWSDETGSSLIEVLIAFAVLTVGLLTLVQVFSLGLVQTQTTSNNLIAREKAREAIESVHTARDTRVLTWAQIRNAADGGVFTDGATPLRLPGPDGLVNTADDCTEVDLPACPATLEALIAPGPNAQIGDNDDVRTPLTQFTREILIEEVPGSPSLRRLTVIVRYTIGQFSPPPFQLVTFVSSFS